MYPRLESAESDEVLTVQETSVFIIIPSYISHAPTRLRTFELPRYITHSSFALLIGTGAWNRPLSLSTLSPAYLLVHVTETLLSRVLRLIGRVGILHGPVPRAVSSRLRHPLTTGGTYALRPPATFTGFLPRKSAALWAGSCDAHVKSLAQLMHTVTAV